MILYIVLLGIIACVVLSGIFSASEMSYSSCNELRLENEAEDGDKASRRALKILSRFDDALGAILIGNNLVNIAASSLGSVAILLIFGSDEKTWIATLVITLAVIIFGETIPKICAKKNANRYARGYSAFIRILMIVLKPLIWLVVSAVCLILKLVPAEEKEEEDESVEELSSLIETAGDEGVLDEEQTELVQNAIDFSDICAYEVMTSRVDMQAINIDDSLEEILHFIEETPYSRIPVYEGSVDHIIGTLHMNHLLKAVSKEEKPDLRQLLMKPCVVYKTAKLPAVLSALKKARQHLAIVLDEYGGTAGVISMEDVLEQIVGEIWDETDTVWEEVTLSDDGRLELDGDMSISDFLELADIREENFEGESETLGGFLCELAEGFPSEGASFRYENLTLKVLEMDGYRVEKVLFERDKEEA